MTLCNKATGQAGQLPKAVGKVTKASKEPVPL